MAKECPKCRRRIGLGESTFSCSCGAKFHQYCWLVVKNCPICGKEIHETTEEEIKMIQYAEEINQQELNRDEEEQILEEQTRQKAEQEKHQVRINHLKSLGKDGYYEYKVISLVDKKGAVDTERLMNELNDLGLDGWRLQCAYTNEMGKDSLSIAGFGINSTADQNILIFERFVKFE